MPARRSAIAARPSRSIRSPATSPARCNRFYGNNLNPDGTFKPADVLRREFARPARRQRRSTDVVHYCGSGVTACHNLLAMEVAGLPGTRLYPGLVERMVRGSARPGGDAWHDVEPAEDDVDGNPATPEGPSRARYRRRAGIGFAIAERFTAEGRRSRSST